MSKLRFVPAAAVLLVVVFAGCSLLFPDVILGRWQQVGPPTVNVIEFTNSTYTYSVAGVIANTGTWTKSGNAYTLNGALFGFVSTTSTITPTFSNSSNTMTFTDGASAVETYNRQ